ncbi:hypothetical protein KW790_00305 [Candidatus Parcubacteria bacterium]|nr:hypothetical protein [Candidatus Parcubacteria bacterium]
MHADFSSMARELGIRPDALRISLGLSTRLQRLVRSAKTFEEITALSGEFTEDSYSNSCGSKFEQIELEEYKERRKELFLAYLDRFQVIEDFQTFGTTAGFQIINEEEAESASEKISSLFLERREAIINDGSPEKLDRLLTLFKETDKFVGDNIPVSVYSSREELAQDIRHAFQSEFSCLNTLEERLALFQKMKGQQVSLSSRHDQSTRFAWKFMWVETESIEELLQIESEIPSEYLDTDLISQKLSILVSERVRKIENFDEALSFTRNFADRDGYEPCVIYSAALNSLAQRSLTPEQILLLYDIWQTRRSHHNSRSDVWRELVPSKKLFDAWDKHFLHMAQETSLPKELAWLLNKSPWNSKTCQTALDRLKSYFGSRIVNASTPEEVGKIEEEAEVLSSRIYLNVHTRKDELRRESNRRNLLELWATIESGQFHGNEKSALVSLFHEFREDLVLSKRILLKLATYFPAENIDEIPDSVSTQR